MIIPIYHAEEYVNSWIDDEKKIMVVETLNLNLCHHAKTLLSANLKALDDYKLKHVIFDKSRAIGLQDPTEQKIWLSTILFPEYKKRSLQVIINIFPKNHISRFGTKNWLDIGKEFGFEFIEMPSMEDAYQYIKEVNNHSFGASQKSDLGLFKISM